MRKIGGLKWWHITRKRGKYERLDQCDDHRHYPPSDWIPENQAPYYDDAKITQRVKRANAVDRALRVAIRDELAMY